MNELDFIEDVKGSFVSPFTIVVSLGLLGIGYGVLSMLSRFNITSKIILR